MRPKYKRQLIEHVGLFLNYQVQYMCSLQKKLWFYVVIHFFILILSNFQK